MVVEMIEQPAEPGDAEGGHRRECKKEGIVGAPALGERRDGRHDANRCRRGKPCELAIVVSFGPLIEAHIRLPGCKKWGRTMPCSPARQSRGKSELDRVWTSRPCNKT